jgi:transcriptional regulator with XRE-family HTH domain
MPNPVHRIEFGQRLRTLRRERGWAQDELAHQAGLDRSYVGGVERGDRNVSLDNIQKLANALGVPVRELF